MIDPVIYTLSWRGLRLSIQDLSTIENSATLHGVNSLEKMLYGTKLGLRLSSLDSWIAKGRRELKYLSDNGYHFESIRSPNYPQNFLNLTYPPLAFTCIGDIKSLNRPMVAVVGSRNPSTLSRDWLEEHLPEFIKQCHATVLSGGARGVDQLAHIISFRQKKPTVCFLPAGLNRVYPSSLTRYLEFFQREGSAIVSQFSPFQDIYKSQFSARNELIAILSQIVLIVEANEKSGTILTAKLAISHNREIAVLPFHPAMTSGAGNLDLLFSGAAMVRNAEDLSTFWSASKQFNGLTQTLF